MKVLVTGGAGFVGSHVAEYYAKKGSEVIIFDDVSGEDSLREVTGMNPRISFADWRPLTRRCMCQIRQGLEGSDWKTEVNPTEGVIKLVEWVSQNLGLFV